MLMRSSSVAVAFSCSSRTSLKIGFQSSDADDATHGRATGGCRGARCALFRSPGLSTLLAVALVGEMAAPVAFISGVLGTLIGGDVLNLSKARRLGAGIVSIGGAGVFDGIFLVGIFSVMLTAIYLPFTTPWQTPGRFF